MFGLLPDVALLQVVTRSRSAISEGSGCSGAQKYSNTESKLS